MKSSIFKIMPFYFAFILLFGANSFGKDTSAKCHKSLTALEVFPQLNTLVSKIVDLGEDIIIGKKAPKFEEVYEISRLTGAIEKNVDNENKEMVYEELANILFSSPLGKKIKKKLKSGRLKSNTSEAWAADYELKRYLRKLIVETVKKFPESQRFILPKIEINLNRKAINAEAENLLKSHTEYMAEKILWSGFESKDEFVKFIKKSKDKKAIELLSLIEKSQLVPVIRAKEEARNWVSNFGFLNQFVIGDSNGTYNSKQRDIMEADHLNVDYNEYKKKDPSLKPKYGMLMKNDPSAEHPEGDLHGSKYGSDHYVLKEEVANSRMTWLPDDMMNRRGDIWNRKIIPWKFKWLMLPYLLKNLKEKGTIMPDKPPPMFDDYEFGRGDWFMEVQIFGRVDFSDIKEFWFKNEPPEGEFLKKLRNQNIAIYGPGGKKF